MRILHVAPEAPYNEGWGYQENLLPKYQAKLGHDVWLIITNKKHDGGTVVEVPCERYKSQDGFLVIRLSEKYPFKHGFQSLSFLSIYDLMIEMNPDFVFFHGLNNITIRQVIKYKNTINPDMKIVQDNHLDYKIGTIHKNDIKNILYRWFFKIMNKYNDRDISRVYGVTPWRKTYAEKIFGISKEKTDVLIMGADDEKIHLEKKNEIMTEIRNKLNIHEDDFLIVTGGKIDKEKKIHILMRSILSFSNVKLVIFGNVLEDIKQEFYSILNNSSNIIYLGWIASEEAYNYFFASDLVFFPGQHSVLWEQACACKVPCVFAKWDGMNHVDAGGNCDFLFPVNEEAICKKINELLFTDKYYQMKRIAESDSTDKFLYSKIAVKSLECTNWKKK